MKSLNDIRSALHTILQSAEYDLPGETAPAPRSGKEFTRLKAYLMRVVGGVPLNPTDVAKSAATKEAFLPVRNSTQDNAIPHFSRLDELWADLLNTDASCRIVVLQGERGSGKTASISWLIDRHHQELVDKGITWFRADILQLYRRNVAAGLSSTDKTYERISLNTYILAHGIYVALAHADKDPAFRGIGEDRAQAHSMAHHLEVVAPADHSTERLWTDLVASWRSVCAEIASRFRPTGIPTNDEEPRKKFLWTAANHLEQYRRDKPLKFADFLNYFTQFIATRAKGGIWLIIDGVDNIDRQDGEAHYLAMLDEMKTATHDLAGAYSKILLLMRDQTYDEFCRTNIIQLPSEPKVHLVELWDPNFIFEHKPLLAAKPKSSYFSEHLQDTKNSEAYAEAYISSLQSFYQLYRDEMKRWILRFPIYQIFGSDPRLLPPVREDDAWRLLFNRNARSFSRNVIVSFVYMMRILHRRALLEQRLTSGTEGWDEWFSTQAKANRRLIPEGSLVAGEDFAMRSNDRTSASVGRWCPNIFQYPWSDDFPRWGGLIALRVLQVIASSRSPKESKICQVLQVHFGYWPTHIVRALRMLREFGLVSMAVRGCSTPTSEPEAGYRVLPKGLFIVNLMFSDPSATYFFAESAAVSEEVQSRFFRHSTGANRSFHLACLRTGCAFLRQVRATYYAEMEFAKARLVQPHVEQEEVERDLEAFRNYHIESGFKAWIDAMAKRIGALSISHEGASNSQAREAINWIESQRARILSSRSPGP